MKACRTTKTQRVAASLALTSLVWATGSPLTFYDTQQLPFDMEISNISTEQSESPFENQYDSDIPNDWLQPENSCSPFHLMEAHFSHYSSFPLSLLKPSSVHDCEELEEDRKIVELESLLDLEPEWLAEATVVGECPWKLARRVFTPDTVPPSIVEVSCLCDGRRCSLLGDFKCIPVTSIVKIWTIEPYSFGRFRSQMVRVTTACVCAQRLGSDGGNAQPGLEY